MVRSRSALSDGVAPWQTTRSVRPGPHRNGPVARLGIAARRGFGRVVPDPFVVAIALTVGAMAIAWGLGDLPGSDGPGARAAAVVAAYGDGLWGLLAFAMQITVMLVLGHVVAEAPAIRRGLAGLARAAPAPRALVAYVALGATLLGLVNWSLALIGGALLAREAGRVAAARGWRIHYPLLCAAGYAGLMVWHGGLSGSAPLKVTRAGDLVEVLGPELAARIGPLGLERTLLSPLNAWVSGGLVVLGAAFFAWLLPREDPDPRPPPDLDDPGPRAVVPDPGGGEGLVDRLERSRVALWALALPLFAVCAHRIATRGVARLDIDTVNAALWAVGLALHGRPHVFLAACDRGIRSCAGVVVQFPLYAGLMGLMNGAGLSAALSGAVAQAGADAVAIVAFLSAGLVNLFVPSGGGQWAVQGPILMRAALDTGVPPERLLLALAYGDQWTNMVQPFWALPLLAITGVRARDIVGYTALWMVVGGAWMVGCLWVVSR